MEIKTLDEGFIKFNVYERELRVDKVEKWQTTDTNVTTHVTGGGGRISTGLDGKVSGRINEVSTSTSVKITSRPNTRIFFNDGSHVTFEGCDFITLEGNFVTLLCYEFGNQVYVGTYLDKKTGALKKYFDGKVFLKEVIKVNTEATIFEMALCAVCFALTGYVYYKVNDWDWWSWAQFVVVGALALFSLIMLYSTLSVPFNWGGAKSRTTKSSEYLQAIENMASIESKMTNRV